MTATATNPALAVGTTADDKSGFQDTLQLEPFNPRDAELIAGWVRARELRWLCPNTPAPLTAAKVRAWRPANGTAFVLREGGTGVAYAELNPLPGVAGACWIGHLIVAPERRRRGVGTALVRGLVRYAADTLRAQRVCLIVFPENVAALRCYEAAGFCRARTEYHRFAAVRGLQKVVRLEWQVPPCVQAHP